MMGSERLLAAIVFLILSNSVSSVHPGSTGRHWQWPAFVQRRGGGETTSQADQGILSTILNQTESNVSNALSTQSPAIPAWKQQLPPVLQRKGPKTLQKINLGGVEIYLLGTAHVSNDSSTDVKLLLDAVEPDCIFVELCEARITLLDGDDENETLNNQQTNSTAVVDVGAANATAVSETKQDFWEKLDNIRQSQGGSRLQALSTLLLTSVQEDYAETLGVELGGEFRAAHRYWKAKNQAPSRTPTGQLAPPNPSLVLGDRPLSLTLVRAWESLWWWPKTKVIAGLMWSSFRKPNPDEIRAWLESVLREESDVLTESLQELRQHFPSLHTTIIAERDAWLAAKLVQTCRVLTQQYLQTGVRKRVVGIVGAGHVPGIIQWLTGNVTSSPLASSSASISSSPEAILLNLTSTKRWKNDEIVQQEMVPIWTREVTQVQRNEEWSWTDPSTATPP